jgi:hypothetical protein
MDVNGPAALGCHRHGRRVVRPTSPALGTGGCGEAVTIWRGHSIAPEISGSIAAVEAVRKLRVVVGIRRLAFFGGQPPIDDLGVHRCPIILLGIHGGVGRVWFCKVLIFSKMLTFKV